MSRVEPGKFHCARVLDDLWRYVDRELSAPDLSGISAHLKACEECRRAYEDRARDANLFRMAFVGSPFGDAFAERFAGRFRAEAPSIARAEESARPWSRRLAARLALAAAILLIGGLVFVGLSPASHLGSLEAVGEVVMEREGAVLEAPERRLRVGDRFRLLARTSGLTMELGDGSTLTLRGPGAFRIEESTRARGAFEGFLEEGDLFAAVSPRAHGSQLRIRSPHAIAEVLGTKFRLEVDPRDRTVLDVEEGEVRFSGDLKFAAVLVSPVSGPYEVLAREGRPRLSAPEGVIPPPASSPPAPDLLPAPEPEPERVIPAVAPTPRIPTPATDLPVTGKEAGAKVGEEESAED